MQNPTSSYSSSSSSPPPIIIHENPNTKKSAINTVDGDQMKNPFLPAAEMISPSPELFEEDFLQNPAPLMTKIDQEYMNWQQHEMVDSMQGFDRNLGNLDEMSVARTQVVEKSADSNLESGKKNYRFSDERMAKTVERRQKRMIKNRESAARSRARKQAYTDQLQNNVMQLQKTNNLLRKRKEANIAILNSRSISAPIYQLRRTSSSHI